MLSLPKGQAKVLTYAGVVLVLLAVGAVDHLTGEDVHVQALYFIPIAIAGWRLGRVGAVLISLVATLVWLGAIYTAGTRSYHPLVWILNFTSQGAAFLTVSYLVATLAESYRKEYALSRIDLLTGLSNRKALIERAASTLLLCRRNARPVCVAYIDLDNFKAVNDSFGHARGDELLRECGRIIRQSLRASDIAARLGGDEFVVFLPETTAEDAATLMERLRAALEAAGTLKSVEVTASVGVVVDDPSTMELEELLKRADVEMYRVKTDTKNRVGINQYPIRSSTIG